MRAYYYSRYIFGTNVGVTRIPSDTPKVLGPLLLLLLEGEEEGVLVEDGGVDRVVQVIRGLTLAS